MKAGHHERDQTVSRRTVAQFQHVEAKALAKALAAR